MRTTTIPSCGKSGRNCARNNEVARLFEIGRVYIPLRMIILRGKKYINSECSRIFRS